MSRYSSKKEKVYSGDKVKVSPWLDSEFDEPFDGVVTDSSRDGRVLTVVDGDGIEWEVEDGQCELISD